MGYFDQIVAEQIAPTQGYPSPPGTTATPMYPPPVSRPIPDATYPPAAQWPIATGIPPRSAMPGFYLGNTFIPIWIPLAGLGLLLILRKK